MRVVPVPDADEGAPLQGGSEVEGAAKGAVSGCTAGNGKVKEPVEGTSPCCRRKTQRTVLDILRTTDVRSWMPTPAKEDDAGSETSDEFRERREREEERRVDAEELHSKKKNCVATQRCVRCIKSVRTMVKLKFCVATQLAFR
jgi:hypothetical protein